jgi:hypothetical protein
VHWSLSVVIQINTNNDIITSKTLKRYIPER